MSEEHITGDLESRIRELLAGIVAGDDIEILKVSFGGGRRGRGLLRVLVDRRGGVTTGELERISRALSLQLDVEDLIPSAFVLEISSPGLEWPLQDEADFIRYANARLRVETLAGERFEGYNEGLRDGRVCIRNDAGALLSWPQADIRRVTRAIDWKKGRGGRSN